MADTWVSVHGPRQVKDKAHRIAAAVGMAAVPCLSCGGTIAPLPASREARR